MPKTLSKIYKRLFEFLWATLTHALTYEDYKHTKALFVHKFNRDLLEELSILKIFKNLFRFLQFVFKNRTFCNATSHIASIFVKSMGIAGPRIEPASDGATTHEQPSLRYQSPSILRSVASSIYVEQRASIRVQM